MLWYSLRLAGTVGRGGEGVCGRVVMARKEGGLEGC